MTSGFWGLYCVTCEVQIVRHKSTFDQIEEAWETHRAGAIHRAGGYLEPEPEDDMIPDDSMYQDYVRGVPATDYPEPFHSLGGAQ